VLTNVSVVVEEAGGVIRNVNGVVERADGVIGSASGVIDDVHRVVGSGNEVVAAANETIRSADPSVRRLAEITDELARLRPVLAGLGDLDPAISRQIESTLDALPRLLERVDSQVLPAVSALEGLVPVVRTLNENVDQLQSVVNDVGTLLSGLPGAARLLKRGGREVRSADNNTSITPPA
jgi:ABC-type transporter Mla subunit MlaD